MITADGPGRPGGADLRAAFTEHVAAFNAHDTARLLAGFADDAVWTTGQDTVHRDGLAELFDDWLWGLLPHLEVRSMVADGAVVAAQLDETLLIDGVSQSFAIAAFFEFRAGLIRRAKVYREGSADV